MGDGPRELLDERPDLEPALRAVLAADDDATGTWTFEDAAVDSGRFGELVSRGVVEKTEDGTYRLADPAAVLAALERLDEDKGKGEGEGDDGAGAGAAANTGPGARARASTGSGSSVGSGSEANGGATRFDLSSVSLPAIPSLPGEGTAGVPEIVVERRVAVALAGALAFLGIVRLLPLPSVFRNGDVVLSGNDAYYYRYWVEQLAGEAVGPLDTSVFTGLPEAVTEGEPLMVATLWWTTSLLGGGATTAGQVLALYPVVSALVTGLLVYLLAVELTDDERVGIAAVLVLAVVPAHAMRTGLGFADHHAFDYPWLALTALSLVVLARAGGDVASRRVSLPAPGLAKPRVSLRAPGVANRRVALGAFGLAAGVAGQTLAWEAAPLLLVPVGVVVVLATPAAVDRDESPALAVGPVAVGLAVAAAATAAVHLGAGWHTDKVAYAPALLLVGTLAVVTIGEGFHRFDLPVRALVGVEAVGLVAGALGLLFVLPTFWDALAGEVGVLLGRKDIVEVQPLFAADTFGWFFLFGFALVLAVPYLAWGTWRAYHTDGAWLVAVVYGWWTLLLASLQLRFAGELSAFAAVFAGLGLVHIAERVDLARRPEPFASSGTNSVRSGTGTDEAPAFAWPDRESAVSLIVLFLLVGSIGMIQTPIKQRQLAIDDTTYRTATWIEGYAAQRGLRYPENYVLSGWGRNRVYNYFVNGESRSYGYARRNYGTFLQSTSPDGWYRQFEDRVGFVIVETGGENPRTMQSRLYDALGSRREGVPGTGHYRAVYDRGGTKVFAVVPGANVTGTGPANATVSLSTSVVVNGTEFEYTRRVQTGPNGEFTVTVAYPGTYTVGNRTVNVPETAVHTGATLRL